MAPHPGWGCAVGMAFLDRPVFLGQDCLSRTGPVGAGNAVSARAEAGETVFDHDAVRAAGGLEAVEAALELPDPGRQGVARKTGAEKRAASLVRCNSPVSPAASHTARAVKARVQKPCRIRPGSPTARAASSSRWITNLFTRGLRVAVRLIGRDPLDDLGKRLDPATSAASGGRLPARPGSPVRRCRGRTR